LANLSNIAQEFLKEQLGLEPTKRYPWRMPEHQENACQREYWLMYFYQAVDI
jgi:hypothetical protein